MTANANTMMVESEAEVESEKAAMDQLKVACTQKLGEVRGQCAKEHIDLLEAH